MPRYRDERTDTLLPKAISLLPADSIGMEGFLNHRTEQEHVDLLNDTVDVIGLGRTAQNLLEIGSWKSAGELLEEWLLCIADGRSIANTISLIMSNPE